jgi:hypothetical protein
MRSVIKKVGFTLPPVKTWPALWWHSYRRLFVTVMPYAFALTVLLLHGLFTGLVGTGKSWQQLNSLRNDVPWS